MGPKDESAHRDYLHQLLNWLSMFTACAADQEWYDSQLICLWN
jgi:hypothetical protein